MSAELDPLFSRLKGLLLDLNGVFYVGESSLAGAVEAIEYLKSNSIPSRFLTNTTTYSIDALYQQILQLGLPLSKSDIISAPYAAVLYLRQLENPKCYLLLNEDVRRDFAEFSTSDTNPDVIIVGDMGDRWNYATENAVFQMMLQGAELIGLHKGKYWQVEGGLRLDIGAFIAGLEYATDKKARIIGKPSLNFFKLALTDLGLPAEQVAMIGDDINADVGGAQQAGMAGILVKTGKYRPELAAKSTVKPDYILDSIALLPSLLSS
jgi:HAD superfamily hydrolase (TIGR01458 family)